ncbi:hypothetical protein DKL61_09730 [Gammaproteobacteria bacterium ESL0073]|nr:hypothetical protein DKL61_09730 [Gammaproteobacteria bacterium ESL0073]
MKWRKIEQIILLSDKTKPLMFFKAGANPCYLVGYYLGNGQLSLSFNLGKPEVKLIPIAEVTHFTELEPPAIGQLF